MYATVEGNKLTLPLSNAITTEGKYTIVFPAGVVTSVDGEKYDGETFTFTVGTVETGIENIEIEAINAIYDLTGRKIEEITKSGIYIVNGKKVFVK